MTTTQQIKNQTSQGVSYLLFGVLVCKKAEKIFDGKLLEKSIKKYKIKEKV